MCDASGAENGARREQYVIRERVDTNHGNLLLRYLCFSFSLTGTIDVWELRQVLEAMGQKPTEEELFQMISEVDVSRVSERRRVAHKRGINLAHARETSKAFLCVEK